LAQAFGSIFRVVPFGQFRAAPTAHQMSEVKGTSVMEAQAEAGLKLFAPAEGPSEVDTPAAEAYKKEIDEKIAALEAEAAKLTGKDNKKERTAKGKEVSDLKVGPQYIDACKVVKGLEPKKGFFVKAPVAATPAPKASELAPAKEEAKTEPKKEKKEKKQESAGLSPAETKELEQLKKDLIERKAKLKAEGMSGGQQNKDAEVVEWVKRMSELKEKQDPGSTQKDDGKKKESKKKGKAPLSTEEQKELDQLQGDLEQYKHRLKTEFGYSNKDMKADEDLQEMEKRLAELEKRS